MHRKNCRYCQIQSHSSSCCIDTLQIVNGYLSMLAETRNKTSCRLDTFVISTQIITAIINRTNQVANNLFHKVMFANNIMDMKYIRFVQVQFASYNLILGMYHQVHHWIFVVCKLSQYIVCIASGYFVLCRESILQTECFIFWILLDSAMHQAVHSIILGKSN